MKFSIGEKYHCSNKNHRSVDQKKFTHATLPQLNDYILIIPLINALYKCSAALIQNGAVFDF